MIRIILILLCFFSNQLYSNNIKVGLLSKHSLKKIEITIADNTRLFYLGKDKSLNQGSVQVIADKEKIRFGESILADHILLLNKSPFKISFFNKSNKTTRIYKGDLEIRNQNDKLQIILSISLEDYIASAVYSELGELLSKSHFPNEDTKKELIAAQEIVIRTYIQNEKKRHLKEPFDFCDLTHCIHFDGIKNTSTLYPEIILKGKDSITGYFHSTCGGILSGPEVYWSKHVYSSHYKRGKDGLDAHCKNSPHFQWETVLSENDLATLLNEKNISELQTIEKQGRVSQIQYKTFSSIKKIPISTFLTKVGKQHGWNQIKSNLFTVKKIRDKFLFKGNGLGHGIGLCQWGAAFLAANGKTHTEILQFYFPDTELKR